MRFACASGFWKTSKPPDEGSLPKFRSRSQAVHALYFPQEAQALPEAQGEDAAPRPAPQDDSDDDSDAETLIWEGSSSNDGVPEKEFHLDEEQRCGCNRPMLTYRGSDGFIIRKSCATCAVVFWAAVRGRPAPAWIE